SQRAFAAVRDGADVETADLEQISFAPRPPPLSSPPRILGQIDRTYIVAASEGELYVVDQHAAHERIAFEAIVESAGARDSSAPLLFPALVELTPARAALLFEFEADLAAAGVAVEPFGG